MAITLPVWAAAFARRVAPYRRPLGWLFNLAILAYVGHAVAQLGLGRVVASLPTNPLFYLIYLVHYAATPVSERWIFRLMWPRERAVTLLALLRKRTMNMMVFGYSGDLWFFLWVRARSTLGERRILSAMKDSSILSGIAAGVGTALLTGWVIATGAGDVITLSIGDHLRALGVAAAVAVFVLPVVFHLRARIFGVGTATLAAVLAIHVARLIVTQLAQAGQWAVVMPQVGFEVWLLFLTLQLLINQIPLVPNADILFLAVGVRLTAGLGVDQTELTALLLATSLYKQAVNFACLALSTLLTGGMPAPAEGAAPAADRAAR